jgi:hypothetical protein
MAKIHVRFQANIKQLLSLIIRLILGVVFPKHVDNLELGIRMVKLNLIVGRGEVLKIIERPFLKFFNGNGYKYFCKHLLQCDLWWYFIQTSSSLFLLVSKSNIKEDSDGVVHKPL